VLLGENERKQKRGAGGRFASGFNKSIKVHFLLKKQVTQTGSGYIKKARDVIAPQVKLMTKRVLTARLKKDFIAAPRKHYGT